MSVGLAPPPQKMTSESSGSVIALARQRHREQQQRHGEHRRGSPYCKRLIHHASPSVPGTRRWRPPLAPGAGRRGATRDRRDGVTCCAALTVFLPLITSGSMLLLDHPKAIAQLTALEDEPSRRARTVSTIR